MSAAALISDFHASEPMETVKHVPLRVKFHAMNLVAQLYHTTFLFHFTCGICMYEPDQVQNSMLYPPLVQGWAFQPNGCACLGKGTTRVCGWALPEAWLGGFRCCCRLCSKHFKTAPKIIILQVVSVPTCRQVDFSKLGQGFYFLHF